jgi:cellulose synthase/poly-beta-1,6-N-acetylglucosamine synthase-like glycosyltransferase
MLDATYLISSLLGTAYVGIPLAYYLWMRRVQTKRPWNIRMADSYKPRIDIILPVYNEEPVIVSRLRNIVDFAYPKQLMQVIVVDSGSTDRTYAIARNYAQLNEHTKILVLQEGARTGKSEALNYALKYAEGEILITTDADTYWEPNVLEIVLSYLADPAIGAVTGTQEILNPSQSSSTKSERSYRDASNIMRFGESKIHSTLIAHGELFAYKREAMDRFDDSSGSDDTAAALKIISKGLRCIQIQSARYYENVYYTWKGNTVVKVRRAEQMVAIMFGLLKLGLKRRLKLPFGIVLANVYLHLFNPLIGLLFYLGFAALVSKQPFLLLIALPILAISNLRTYCVSFVSHNSFLLIGIVLTALGHKQTIWRKVQETRMIEEKDKAIFPIDPKPH